MPADLDWMLVRELTKWGLTLVGTVSKYVDERLCEYHLVIDSKTNPPLGIMMCLGIPPYSEERIEKAVRLARVGLYAMKNDLKDNKWV